jgi:hypothetical protein
MIVLIIMRTMCIAVAELEGETDYQLFVIQDFIYFYSVNYDYGTNRITAWWGACDCVLVKGHNRIKWILLCVGKALLLLHCRDYLLTT